MRNPTTPRNRSALFVATGLVWAVAMVACGPQQVSSTLLEEQVELSAAGLVAENSSVTGRVILLGGPPKTLGQVIDVGGNPFCTQHGKLINPTWKMDSEGGLADVVITVSGSQRASNLPEKAVVIDQKNCEYLPTMTAIQAGQSIAVRNSDLTYHNVRLIRHQTGTLDKGQNLENIAQAGQGDEWVRELRRPGVYRLECDIHRWMRAWIIVHEGIHKSVSGLNGRYAIERALPDGEYTVSAWHPRFKKSLSKTVQVVNGSAVVDFAFDFSHSFDASLALDS
jgi:plastocyanin